MLDSLSSGTGDYPEVKARIVQHFSRREGRLRHWRGASNAAAADFNLEGLPRRLSLSAKA